MRAPRLRGALAAAVAAASILLPAAATAAPTISGADTDTWNAATAPPSYVITGNAEGATIAWQLQADGAAVPGMTGSGPSPLTVTLDGAPDGALRLIAAQTLPPDPADGGRSSRSFTLDTVPPAIAIARPAAGAVYDQGESVIADFSCTGAVACTGTVADGSPLDTASPGTYDFTVTASDGAGNPAEAGVEYRVAAVAPVTTPPKPATAAAPAAPAGTPTPPSPPIRLAPPAPGAAPADSDLPEVQNATRLRPAAGAAVTVRRPVLRWSRAGRARLYNLQVFRVRDGRATQVLSVFPTVNHFRVPAGRLAWGQRYVWRVWPLIGNSYSSTPLGLSWFDLRRPVRLTRAQLLVNQRISQAALRRTTAISDWLDAGLVASDLRDGGLGPRKFAGDVSLAGAGTAIDNGFAAPRPLVTPPPARSGTARIRVSARQLLVNQRISQAAVRRANALARRIEGGLTGGDLRAGAVTATKLAPGLRIASARPAGPRPAPSTTAIRAAKARPHARVRMSDGQVLVNQRISQAAVRRANALATLIGGGLTGAQFEDGAITALEVAPSLR